MATAHRPITEIVHEDVMTEFHSNITLPLEIGVEAELAAYLIKGVFPLIDQRKIEWDGRAKRFILSCAAGMGRAADRFAVKNKKPYITVAIIRDILRDEKRGLLHCWERVCPLPDFDPGTGEVMPEGVMFVSCRVIRGHIKEVGQEAPKG